MTLGQDEAKDVNGWGGGDERPFTAESAGRVSAYELGSRSVRRH
jgi:hypothetical protein